MALEQHQRPPEAEGGVAMAGIERRRATEMLLGGIGPLLGERQLTEIELHIRIAGELLQRLLQPVARPLEVAGLGFHHAELEHELALPRQGLQSLAIGAARIVELPVGCRSPCLPQKLFHAHISRAPTAKERASSCNRASLLIAAAGAPSSSSTVASSLRKAPRLIWAILSNRIAGWSTPACRIAAMKMLRGPCGMSRSPSRRWERVMSCGPIVIRGTT